MSEANRTLTRREKAKKLYNLVPAIYLAVKRKDAPFAVKLFGGFTVMYVLSPIDIVHDFIPPTRYLDNVLIIPALVRLTLKYMPRELFLECREKARGMWRVKPVKWYYSIPFVLFWTLIIFFIVWAILGGISSCR